MFHDRIVVVGAREQAWDKNLQLLLIAIIGFNIFPHISSIPTWATVIAIIFLIWKTLSLTRGVSRPPRWFLYVTTLCCSAGVFREYGTIVGSEPASALLVTLASAKLLETNRYRDAMFVIFTSFFLLMAHLLDSQSIMTTIYMAFDVMLITALMFQLHKQERRKSARAYRPVMRMLALAIPVWIFLFITFPRFSAGFGANQQSGGAGGSFSEDLDPGGIESLADSDEPAFRVTFKDGKVPRMDDMYWRGAVLTQASGLKWQQAKEKTAVSDVTVPSREAASAFFYEIYLEPRFQSWLFALDYPESLSMRQMRSLKKKSGFIYENLHPTGGQVVYQAVSSTLSPAQRMLNTERTRNLQLPALLDPRIFELAKRFESEARARPATADHPTLADRIGARALDWYEEQRFRYTKSPGALKDGSSSEQLAQFLFETKRGFCEHYAASFATIMRAAGVPARVTVGFLGATRNPYGGYYLVRDLEAHAWAEIWRDDPEKPGLGRWVRVDPTSLIAPMRLQMGGDYNLLNSEEHGWSQAEAELQLKIRHSQLFYKASAAWDLMQMKWNTFLNNYDFDSQKSLLEKLGLKNITRWTLFGIAFFGVLLFSIGLMIFLRRRAHKIDPVLASWNAFCRKLEKAGVKREASEGPLDFTVRAAAKFPQQAERLLDVGTHFAELRYGEPSTREPDALRTLRKSVRNIAIPRT